MRPESRFLENLHPCAYKLVGCGASDLRQLFCYRPSENNIKNSCHSDQNFGNEVDTSRFTKPERSGPSDRRRAAAHPRPAPPSQARAGGEKPRWAQILPLLEDNPRSDKENENAVVWTGRKKLFWKRTRICTTVCVLLCFLLIFQDRKLKQNGSP